MVYAFFARLASRRRALNWNRLCPNRELSGKKEVCTDYFPDGRLANATPVHVSGAGGKSQ